MDENGNIVFDGYCIELLHDIKKILNFEYDIYEVKDGTYGVMNEDNEWNGMIRELVDKVRQTNDGPDSGSVPEE